MMLSAAAYFWKFASLEEMDEDLRDAAQSGNVDYLRKCVETDKPIEYYLTYYCPHGNIFHMAAFNNREEFLREAIRLLFSENTQQLLLQPLQPYGNPLHVAAGVGNVEIVKIILDVYRCLPTIPSDHSKQPWLHKAGSIYGYTPCFLAVAKHHEDCALEILKMDTELLSNIACSGVHLIYEAILHKFTKLALEIVRAPHSIGCTGPKGCSSISAISVLNYSKEAEEIFRRLLQREPGLIEQRNDEGWSVFHSWVEDGEMWPFECLLKCHDIIPNVKAVFVNLVSSMDKYGYNPLHDLALYTSNEVSIEIAKLFIDIYKQESPNISEDVLPWLVQNIFKDTPLSLAISCRHEKLAVYILLVDENAVIKNQKNVLFLAIERGCHEVAEKILEVIEKQGWTHLLYNDNKNALHLAPLCKNNLCTRLIEGHPELLEGVEKGGITILHNWVKSGEVWLFEYVLKSKWRSSFVKLLVSTDYNNWNNPFHVAAMITTNEAINQIIKLLVAAYKEDFPYWSANSVDKHPCFMTNKAKQGPLHLAILNQCEELALYILSLHEKPFINELLDIYEPHHTVLFLAIQNNCRRVAEYILLRLDKQVWTNYLKDSSDGSNILHLATTLEDKEFGEWLVNKAPEYITDQDNNKQSPWDKAYETGSSWFIEASLKKDPSVFYRAPLAWTKACENGHVSTLKVFIDHNPGAFRDLCIEHKDSPLHHIQLPSLTKYEEFLEISRMKDLINLQDSQGETPLHISIQNRNKPLTETLLSIEKIAYSIKNKDQKTVVDLLAQVCEEDNTWEEICQRIGFDPWIKTSYFQQKTNLFEVRNSLFVVAALLATITFTAGFTLPGGLNQETGEALLAKKVAFLVFLMSNTLAMCTSMLVLICLVWSMAVQDSSSKSLMLIDRSMWLLMVAFYSTLLAFMAGVFTVISPKVLWAAIIVSVMCSLIGISANRTLLYKVLFISSAKKKPMHLLELKLGPYGDQSSCPTFEFKGNDFEKLKEIRIRSGNLVDAIEFYTVDDYEKPKDVKFGGKGGREKLIELQAGEVITAISGRFKDSTISQLKIFTNSEDKGYGPYGENTLVGGESFESPALNNNEAVVGFCGSVTDDLLSSIGLIVQRFNK